jgi:LysM repeat protein
VAFFFATFTAGYIALRIYVLPPAANEISYSNNNFNFLGLNIPANLHFCGEKIPPNNYEIIRNLQKEFFNNTYWKANSSVLFAKAQKWFPYIEPILRREGVPDDFKYVAIIESHLSNIVSPAGAAGFWQLVPSVANNYGLEVNEHIDERYHVEKSTAAACKLFKQAYSVFNNWTLAAAAYNLGIGGIQEKLKKQKAKSYYEMILNRETGSFVYRILAYKTLFSSPAHFGIKKKKFTYLPLIPFKVFKVDSSITDLGAFAKHCGCTKSAIKFFNPWIMQDQIPNPERKTYFIRVPKNSRNDYSSYIKDLAGEDGDLLMDADSPPEESLPVPDTSATEKIIQHLVKEKETLKEIAGFYEVSEEQLRQWNKIVEKQEPVAGQTLQIYFRRRP